MKNLYDEKKDAFFEMSFSSETSSKLLQPTLATMEEIHAFVDRAQPIDSAHIIELGAGDGRFSLPLLKLGFQITAMDSVERALETLKKAANILGIDSKLKTIKSDLTNTEDNMIYTFDVGLLVSTFYMLAPKQNERIAILNNLIKYIKPGGKVVILDPNPLCPLFYPYYLLHPRVRWAIEKNFLYSNRWNMKRIYKRMGLKDVTVYPYGFFPGFVINIFPILSRLNKVLVKIPIINYFSTFNFFIGTK